MDPLTLLPGWQIPEKDLRVAYVRSSGPGGQNVNKVATKVELRLRLSETSSLSESQKSRLRARHPSLVTQGGDFLVVSDETRSQSTNLTRVRERLRHMILEVRQAPKVRRPTGPSRAAKRRRLDDKKKRSLIKKSRSRSFD